MQKNGQPGSEKKKPGAHTPKDGRPHSGNEDRPSSGQRTSGLQQNERAEDRKRPGSGKGKVLYKILVRFCKLAKMAGWNLGLLKMDMQEFTKKENDDCSQSRLKA